MTARASFLLLTLAACILPWESAAGRSMTDGGRIWVVYEAPKSASSRGIYREMREHRVLERVSAVVGLVRLPPRLTYRLKECAEYAQVAFAFRTLIGPHLRMRPGGGGRLRRAFRSAFWS